ncbi:stage III sporulation protein AE [Clostridium sp. NSJ-49]|uniref:Sporulation stage III, protein AE n=1 Tax=Clostridium disporicum TaxID=84024 RepID=A0A174GA88_9CLOT|nr:MULTISPECIES: stage III sporulation protein AE [Clostridium]MBC5625453.1 stage III sporulation protein AE [Clostridium sp. NSJ-49]MCD2500207.1 stage III sporulation protein AE [Clostridium sp. NSJ-145]MDU6340392.1 stage III sporulation protein AE [Clostridium sp.]CUO58038.1 sporulation stage III%2C protein AE [Clostridium disporicum]
MNKKIKRIFLSLIFSIILFSFGSVTNISFAEDNITSVLGNDEIQSEVDSLYNYINTMKSDIELMNELDPVSYIKAYMEDGKGNISLSKIGGAVVSLLLKEVKSVLGLSFSIIAIGIISALLKSLQEAFNSEGISEVAFYACYALMIVILTKTFLISLDMAKDVITNVVEFMSKLLPVLVLMLGAAGGLTQAATMDPIVLGATILIPQLYLNIIIPLILSSFVLQFANNMTNGSKLSNLCDIAKKSTIWIQGIIITIFIGLLTVRGITSSTIDAVTLKTTKFAIDNFIPIVGKSFSDAISSVAGYSLIIKNAIGSIGLIVIILIILYPIIKIVLSSIIFKLSASLLEPIADKRITKSIAAAGESLTLIMSCVLCVSLMFFLLIAMMVQAGKFVIGG